MGAPNGSRLPDRVEGEVSTYLFITKPEFRPGKVRPGNDTEWSCSSSTRIGDRALVHVTGGTGIMYEWRVTSDAVRNERWGHNCNVEYVSTFRPPISIGEIRAAVPRADWTLPYTMFRGLSSLRVPSNVAKKIRALRHTVLQSLESIEEEFDTKVAASRKLSPAQRRERLASAPQKPTKIEVRTTAFRRNPDVAAEVLSRADGFCEGCRLPAPFLRAADGSPYLELHHVVRLAIGGDDTVENALALCPNCHRKAHYGRG